MLVKVCGIRSIAGAQACANAGVDFAGLNFVPSSSRLVPIADARALLPHLGAVQPVAVLADQEIAEVREIAASLGIGIVQLHGSETPAQCAELAAEFRVFKAIDLQRSRDKALIDAYARSVAMFVVDGREPGSGESWEFAKLVLQDGCLRGVPVLLAGGLHPGNVAAALAAVRPTGADCASGIERSMVCSGRFVDPEKVAAFTQRARRAL